MQSHFHTRIYSSSWVVFIYFLAASGHPSLALNYVCNSNWFSLIWPMSPCDIITRRSGPRPCPVPNIYLPMCSLSHPRASIHYLACIASCQKEHFHLPGAGHKLLPFVMLHHESMHFKLFKLCPEFLIRYAPLLGL